MLRAPSCGQRAPANCDFQLALPFNSLHPLGDLLNGRPGRISSKE